MGAGKCEFFCLESKFSQLFFGHVKITSGVSRSIRNVFHGSSRRGFRRWADNLERENVSRRLGARRKFANCTGNSYRRGKCTQIAHVVIRSGKHRVDLKFSEWFLRGY